MINKYSISNRGRNPWRLIYLTLIFIMVITIFIARYYCEKQTYLSDCNSYTVSYSEWNYPKYFTGVATNKEENKVFPTIIKVTSIIGVFWVLVNVRGKYNLEKKQSNNKTPEELAGVPLKIKFDQNDLPIDVDNSGFKWGRKFTVFVTNKGKCFHRNKGCSGAVIEKHVFDALSQGIELGCKRCSRDEIISIPKWYYDYKEIKRDLDI